MANEKLGKGVKFERIRRITGYLVGTIDRWNNAKKAEERDRVKHGMEGKKDSAELMVSRDVVPVVRCKDCKWYKESKLMPPIKFCFRLIGKDGNHVGYNFSDDDFCSRGERRTDEVN